MKNLNNMKGLIFAGDSYTWGQGLYYYSELPNIKFPPPNHYIREYVTEAHMRFKDTQRFARIVANNFNTFELTKDENGGSDMDSLMFIDNVFNSGYTYDDISYIIFQTTQPFRSNFDFTYKGVEYSAQINKYTKIDKITEDAFNGWLAENNYDYGYFEFLQRSQILQKIKNMFLFYEGLGIKCKIMCWVDDYVPLILNDEYLNNRFIKIKYLEEEFLYIQALANKHNKFLISDDPYFAESPGDSHVSLAAQRLIADSIIQKINKD